MKITKDDWMKLASPVVLIVVGILLACSIIDSVGDALQLNCWNRSIDYRRNLHVIRIRQEQECLR